MKFAKAVSVFLFALVVACAPASPVQLAATAIPVASFKDSPKSLRIVGSPPFTVLAPAIEEFNKKNGTSVQLVTLPDIEIMNLLKAGAKDVDAVAPSTEQWLTMAGAGLLVGQTDSFFKSPVVLAVRKQKAEELKLAGRQDVTVAEFEAQVVAKKVKFAMPSPSVSGVGSAAHLSFIDALKGHSGPVTSADLQDPVLRQKLQELYSGVQRSSSDSKTLTDQVLANPDSFDAFVNFEAYVLQINRDLASKNKDPYTLVYLVDGMAVAEFPFGPINGISPEKQKLYEDFKNFLLTDEVNKQIHEQGWRTGLFGLTLGDTPPAIFNGAWGVQKNPVGSLQYPNVKIFEQARNLYQTLFRLGSITVYVADHSGSMDGFQPDKKTKRVDAMRGAFKSLLDAELAASYGLAPTPNDVSIFVPFCSNVPISDGEINRNYSVVGSDKAKLNALLGRIVTFNLCGNTAIFDGLNKALQIMKTNGVGNLSPAIVLLTDGENTAGQSESTFLATYRASAVKPPIYAILFGSARVEDIKNTLNESKGAWWDANANDLATIVRRVRAQN